MTVIQILIGDVRQRLADLPDNSIHCAVTSPPYFGLRDYGCDGQIGLEPTPDAYVVELVNVFREVRRVLRDDGTLWLNLGDSYAAQRGGSHMPAQTVAGGIGGKGDDKAFRGMSKNRHAHRDAKSIGLKHKDRLMIPARVALALQADGWWLRDEIIWHKPNPMPVSVTDRTTPAHEMVYMLSKSARYYYDMEAVKEPAVGGPRKPQRKRPERLGSIPPRHASFAATHTALDAHEHDGTRQPRSVWSVATRPFKGAHFATFPPDLIRPCILAGCPVNGTVLDPFFGAGTTGLVARELGRHAIGCELNPTYAAIASERLGLVPHCPVPLPPCPVPLPA